MTTTISLRRLVDVIDCAHVTAPFVDDDRRFPVASIQECQGAFVDLSDCKYTTKEFFDHLRASDRAPRIGDLLFIRNVSVGLVSAVAPGTPEFAVGQETVLLRRTSEVDPIFLRYALVGAEARHAVESAMIGSTFRRINVSAIRALPVALPPPEEQRLIANYLDRETARIDTLIEEQQRLIEMLFERRGSLIEYSLLESSDAPIRLSRVASSRSGDVPPPLEEDGQFRIWGAGRAIGRTSRINARAGDLLVGRVGQGSVGKVRRLTEDAWASDNTIILRLNQAVVDPRFIEHGLRLIPRFELVGGGAMPLVTADRLLAQSIPFTALKAQRRIADFLDEMTAKIDTLIAETERFIELSRERRAALITAAVTGQIDVRGVV